MTFIEEMQRRLAPTAPSLSPFKDMATSFSSPNLSTPFGSDAVPGQNSAQRSEHSEMFDVNDTPFELRVLEVALDVVRPVIRQGIGRQHKLNK